MGNINNIWFLKDGGGSWADSKCENDQCYSIPYLARDEYWFQVDIPEGFTIDDWWLCHPDGTRIQALKDLSEWKIITDDDPYMQRLIFKMPAESYACIGMPCTKCLADMDETGNESWVADYIAGVNNVQVTLIDLSGPTNWDVTDEAAPLPPGFERVSKTTFYVPCDLVDLNWNIQFVTDDPGGNHTQNWPLAVTEEEVEGCGDTVDCWHIEIPLFEEDEEVATLQSEPHHCPTCEPTVVLYGDYCLSPYDVFGELIFNTDGIGETQYGDLTEAQNRIRIQATIKRVPSLVEWSRNVRCNNFGSKVTPRYRLQGYEIGYPDYMVAIIESLFAAKSVYIDGVEYMPKGDALFTERNIQNFSMKRLDVELEKCVSRITYDCSCVPAPVDCEIDPIEYDSIVYCVPAPDEGYGVDRSIWRFEIDPGALSGGTPPYVISDWTASIGVGTIAPDNTFAAFNDASPVNFYRRGTAYASCLDCLNVTVKITDANGCEKILGNTLDIDDLRCVEQAGYFEVKAQSDTTITIGVDLPATSQPWDYSFDNVSYLPSMGLTGGASHTITGLTPNTTYSIYIRVSCGGGQYGFIGPLDVTTDP